MRAALWALSFGLCAAVLAETATVKGAHVRVRARADTKAEVLLVLKKGDAVEVIGDQAGWKKIQVPASVIVWVHKNLVARDAAAPAQASANADDVYVRAGPSQNYSPLGKLKKGDKVEIVKEQGDWLGIKPSAGIAGWVAADFLETKTVGQAVTPATTPTPQPAAPLPQQPPAATPSVPANPVSVTREGTLKDHATLFPRPGTHELWNEADLKPFLISYLDSKDLNLARYVGKRVQVTGEERTMQGWSQPLLDVTAIKVIE